MIDPDRPQGITSGYVSIYTGLPVTPMPDDFCRNCYGRRHASDGTPCDDCHGTGWQGVKYAPSGDR